MDSYVLLMCWVVAMKELYSSYEGQFKVPLKNCRAFCMHPEIWVYIHTLHMLPFEQCLVPLLYALRRQDGHVCTCGHDSISLASWLWRRASAISSLYLPGANRLKSVLSPVLQTVGIWHISNHPFFCYDNPNLVCAFLYAQVTSSAFCQVHCFTVSVTDPQDALCLLPSKNTRATEKLSP